MDAEGSSVSAFTDDRNSSSPTQSNDSNDSSTYYIRKKTRTSLRGKVVNRSNNLLRFPQSVDAKPNSNWKRKLSN